MNREIKFRAFLKDRDLEFFKKLPHVDFSPMVKVNSIDFEEKIIFYDDPEKIYYIQQFKSKIEDIVLMQYTGFKDCDGNEIYAGDILFSKDATEAVAKKVVIWDREDGSWRIPVLNDNEEDGKSMVTHISMFRFYNSDNMLCLKIIGNIYEGLKDE